MIEALARVCSATPSPLPTWPATRRSSQARTPCENGNGHVDRPNWASGLDELQVGHWLAHLQPVARAAAAWAAAMRAIGTRYGEQLT